MLEDVRGDDGIEFTPAGLLRLEIDPLDACMDNAIKARGRSFRRCTSRLDSDHLCAGKALLQRGAEHASRAPELEYPPG